MFYTSFISRLLEKSFLGIITTFLFVSIHTLILDLNFSTLCQLMSVFECNFRVLAFSVLPASVSDVNIGFPSEGDVNFGNTV